MSGWRDVPWEPAGEKRNDAPVRPVLPRVSVFIQKVGKHTDGDWFRPGSGDLEETEEGATGQVAFWERQSCLLVRKEWRREDGQSEISGVVSGGVCLEI